MNSSVNWKSLHIRLEAASQQDEASATKNTASNQNQTLYELVQKENGGESSIWMLLFASGHLFLPPILLQKGLLFLFFSFYFWGISWKKYENCLKDSTFL